MECRDKIIRGLELHQPIPEKSLGKVLNEYFKKYGDKTALIDELTGNQLTYNEIRIIAYKLSNSIKNRGYTQEDILGICCENNINYFGPILAALYLGIPIAPISQYYSLLELQQVLTVTKPKLVFCSKLTVDSFLKLKKTNEFIKTIVVIDSNESKPGSVTLEHFMDDDDLNFNFKLFEPVDVDIKNHTAVILFSSGTTGLPKGVMLTHKNILMCMMLAFDPRMYRNIFDNPTNLGHLPFSHAFGFMTSIFVLGLGNSIIVLSKFKEKVFLDCIQKYKIRSLGLVPSLMVMLTKSSTLENYDLTSLKHVLTGAAPLSEYLEKELKSRLDLKSITQLYGLTESTFGIILIPSNEQKSESIGNIIPGMSAIVKNSETGKYLGPNEIGEICIKGDMVMKGYYKNSQATKDTFTDDGWLKTGDLGYYDEDNYFHIVDRLKELIKYKGFQVPPAEIEGLLIQHPKIRDAAVIGLADERAGELPLAFIVKQTNVELSEEEVKDFVAQNLSPHKCLHGGVRFIDSIPKGPSGKILRRVLKQKIKEETFIKIE